MGFPRASITVSAPDQAGLQRAAQRLRHYLHALFGFDVLIDEGDDARDGDVVFHLRCDAHSHAPPLTGQGYAIRTAGDGRAIELCGGSAPAVNWAVSELAEFWGVRFLSYRDVLPDAPGAFAMPELPLVREPVLRTRGVRIYNDWPNDPCRWPLADIEVFLEQLARLRINHVDVMIRAYDPFCDYQWRGARKDLAVTDYGYHLPIDDRTIGYPLFEASGDAARGAFSNPDLDHADYDEAVAAGAQFLRGIRAATRDRGIDLAAVVHWSDFPEPIKRRLAELSRDTFDAESDGSGVTRIRYGRWTEGPTPEMARAMSIRNPLYLDLLRCQLQAQIDALAEFDEICLWPSEFRGATADARFAWEDLDRRFRLHEIATLDDLVDQARARAEIDADRAEHEMQADVIALWVFDELLNRRSVRCPPSLTITPAALNPVLHSVIARVFQGGRYLGHTGYMPTTAARHLDSFACLAEADMRARVVVTLEDDNIGPVPQESTPSVAVLAQAMVRHRLDGFMTRQWNYTKVMPALHYLSHVAWDAELSPDGAVEHFFAPLCGEKALPTLMEAIRVLQETTTKLHTEIICPAFLSPHLISGRWEGEDAAYFGSNAGREQNEALLASFEEAARRLAHAAQNALPTGRSLLTTMQRQSAFACAWLRGLLALSQAVDLKKQSVAADGRADIDAFDRHLGATNEQLTAACRHIREATECWVETVEDRADLGVLAALNEYGVKSVEAIRHLVNIDATSWSRRGQESN